jgi:hypothetical protein
MSKPPAVPSVSVTYAQDLDSQKFYLDPGLDLGRQG